MLPARQRLTAADDFRRTVRRGRRRGGRLLVVHRLRTADDRTARAGVVVSRAVGTAVTRNLVKRRLRHLLAQRLGQCPEGTMLVLRAQPAAAGASYAELGAQLDAALVHIDRTDRIDRIDGMDRMDRDEARGAGA